MDVMTETPQMERGEAVEPCVGLQPQVMPPWHYVADSVPQSEGIRAVAIYHEGPRRTYVCRFSVGPHPDTWRAGRMDYSASARYDSRIRYAWRDLTPEERQAYEEVKEHNIKPPPFRAA